jgi:iron complex outermembrane receptor protein
LRRWIHLVALLPISLFAEADFFAMSLDELANYPLTTAAKKPVPLQQTPAAVFVITGDDLRRSGYTTLPDALRLVPGMQVRQIESSNFAVSSRGFAHALANKMLVLIDGRSVYGPLYGGVFWDVQDVLLEDVERIEVIRGPGGSLWGANAVNGIVNIVTKPVAESERSLISMGGGNNERGFGHFRSSTELDENLRLRVFGKYFDREDSHGNGSAGDSWDMARLGFRLDWDPTPRDSFTLQGSYYDGEVGMDTMFIAENEIPIVTCLDGSSFVARADSQRKGGDVMLRWQRTLDATSDMSLQLYVDRSERDFLFAYDTQNTVDLEWQLRFLLGERHEMSVGTGYRYHDAQFESRSSVEFRGNDDTLGLWHMFVQDKITLIPERLSLSLSMKVEHNEFTHSEYQPSVLVSWTPREHLLVWGAVTRAVRIPTRYERYMHLPIEQLAPGTFSVLEGSMDFDSEELIAYELGLRQHPHPDWTVDFTLFYNDYDELLAATPGPASLRSTPFPHVHVPITPTNNAEALAFGAESAVWWQVNPRWRLHASYSYMQLSIDVDSPALADFSLINDTAPRHQAVLRSSCDLSRNIELDLILRHQSSIDILNLNSYTGLDMRLGWQASPAWEFSLAARDLLDAAHPESANHSLQVRRGVYLQVTRRF